VIEYLSVIACLIVVDCKAFYLSGHASSPAGLRRFTPTTGMSNRAVGVA
jgi:hypothetical protein